MSARNGAGFTSAELEAERKEWAEEDARRGRTWPVPAEFRESEESARLDDAEDIRKFVLAGNATFTLVSIGTGVRFTFRVRAQRTNSVTYLAHSMRFVSVLTGSSNENDFEFLGSIFSNGRYSHGRKSRVTLGAPSSKAFAWFWARLAGDRGPSPVAEFWHEGKCGRCGRKLTVPESIASGIGPECSKRAS